MVESDAPTITDATEVVGGFVAYPERNDCGDVMNVWIATEQGVTVVIPKEVVDEIHQWVARHSCAEERD